MGKEETIDPHKFRQFLSIDLLARQVVEGFITGLHKSPFHGFSVEFAEHRLYNSGESTKHIDWKLYGRTDKLFVKRYEDETNLRCQLIIDISSSMYFPVLEKPSFDTPNKLTFSVYAAACIIQLLRQQRDAAGLSLFSDSVELHTAARSSSTHQKYLITELEKLLNSSAENKKTSTTEALHYIAENIHKRSLVVIFSDMFDNSEQAEKLLSALHHIKHNKHEVILFHTIEKNKEINFDYKNRPYKFIDMESGEHIKLLPAEVKELYIKEANDFRNSLKLRCAQYQIDYIEADINKGFKDILLPYLLKRQKMH